MSQNEVQLAGTAYIRVQLDHLFMFNRALSERLTAQPARHMGFFETAASNLYFELTQNKKEDDSLYMFQVQLYIKAGADVVRNNIRTLGSSDVTKLVVFDGIVISASKIQCKASSIQVRCRKCGDIQRFAVRPGYGGVTFPRYRRARASRSVYL